MSDHDQGVIYTIESHTVKGLFAATISLVHHTGICALSFSTVQALSAVNPSTQRAVFFHLPINTRIFIDAFSNFVGKKVGLTILQILSS